MALRSTIIVFVLSLALAVSAQDDDAAPFSQVAPTLKHLTSHIVVLNNKPPIPFSEVASAFRQARGVRSRSRVDSTNSVTAAVTDYATQIYQQQADLFNQVINSVPSTEDGAAGSGRREGEAARGAARITGQFAHALNGFSAAGLSEEQVRALEAHPDVRSVSPDGLVYSHTVSTPDFLNIPGPIWQQQYGREENAAAGVLVAVIDTGINSAAASFSPPAAAAAGGASPWPALGGGSAACGEVSSCTPGKVVACRFFEAGIDAYVQAYFGLRRRQADLSTCQDLNGHGTHTTSTAAGARAPAISGGAALSEDGMIGVAPGAAAAVYKVLWDVTAAGSGGQVVNFGTFVDVVSAIEQAVVDGADVINYSVGSEAPPFLFQDPVMEAFMGAAAAGVTVVASGGNAGASSPVGNAMPWAVTVAAGTHAPSRAAEVAVEPEGGGGGGGGAWGGKMLWGSPVGPAPLYFAGTGRTSAARCYDGALDESKVAGKIVICLRGVNKRSEKSAEVARAGGVGMILANTNVTNDATLLEAHSVPTIHVDAPAGEGILEVLRAANGTCRATLSGASWDAGVEAPVVAGFSSRGPSATDSSALLKPDILAPGVDVFAAWLRVNGSNDTAAPLSGTSMAAPHIAGIAALVIGKHPDWSPAAVKSAIMTTASQVTNKGNPLTGTPFEYGAGMIDPVKAMDPGLVYDAGEVDYQRYMCTTFKDPTIEEKVALPREPPAYCRALCKKPLCTFPQTLRDFNHPSFAFSYVRRGARVRAFRRVKYVGAGAAAFRPSLQLPKGFTGGVLLLPPTRASGGARGRPSGPQLSFSEPEEERGFTLWVVVPRTASEGGHFGSLTWTDEAGRYSVRSPIAIIVGQQ